MSARRAEPQSHAAARAPYEERDWIARIRESDHAAFETLVRQYSDRLCAFVYTNTRDVEATKELVQDLFLWIWLHRHEWEIRGDLTTYLYRSARNRAVSYMRHARLEQRWQEEVERDSIALVERTQPILSDADANATELSEAIERAVGSLPHRGREVFTLNREHHLSYREIADTLGISVKTVEVHMGRALAALRRQLMDWLTD